jgi:outer membrane protein assembly factor BamB
VPATSSGPAGPGWSAAHADGRNSDYADVAGPTALRLAWQRDIGPMINLGATFGVDGEMYVTSTAPGCHLQALDAATGETRWCAEAVDRLAVVSSPLIDADGTIYLADGAAMHAFDPTGRELWATPIHGVPLSAQFTGEGRLIFVTHLGTIYVLRRDTGEPMLAPLELVPGATFDPAAGLWACAMGRIECPSANTPAYDVKAGRLVFTFWDPAAPQAGIRAMRYTEDPAPALEPVWVNESLPGGSASSPAVSAAGDRIYVTDNAGSLHALDAATGTAVWSVGLGYAAGGSASVAPDGVVMPAGGGDVATVAVADRGDAGEVLWSNAAVSNRGIATQAAGDVAYITAGRSGEPVELVVVDTRTGAELDREPMPGARLFGVGTTIGPDGWVYVPTFDGKLYAFAPG